MSSKLILKIKDSYAKPQVYSVQITPGQTLRFGRGTVNDIILENPFVSREHFILSWKEDGPTVLDLGSKNGTWINEKAVENHIALCPGDCIELSGVKILVLDPELLTENMDNGRWSSKPESRTSSRSTMATQISRIPLKGSKKPGSIFSQSPIKSGSAGELRLLENLMPFNYSHNATAIGGELNRVLLLLGGVASFILMI